MKRRTLGLVGMGLVVVALLLSTASVALARGPFGLGARGTGAGTGPVAAGTGQGIYGPGPGAMMGGPGSRGNASTGTPVAGAPFGPGPNGIGPNGMMRSGYGHGGMMGGWAQGNPNQPAIALDQARQNVQGYLDRIGNQDLTLDEVMEFQDNFYAIVKEKSTGIGAFEVLVNKWTGAVMPEPGPNHMWNTKYGMMGQNSPMGQWMGYQPPTGPMTVTADQARQIAQKWLDQYQPGSTTETPDQFYGYYTVHTLKGGTVTGMLSVNGYTGQVWYHTWHGTFIRMQEVAR